MATTPTYRLSDGSNTVILEGRHAPEEFREPTRNAPRQARKKLDGGPGYAGFTNVVRSLYTISGQTLTTLHRWITPAMHAQLNAWKDSGESLTWTGTVEGSDVQHTVMVWDYDGRPRTVPHHWDKSNRAETLTILFLGDE